MKESRVGGKMFVTGQYVAELVNPGDDRFDLPTLLVTSQFSGIFEYLLLVLPVRTTRCCMEMARLSASRAKDHNHTADYKTLLTFLSVCSLITSCNSICSPNSALFRVRRRPARCPVVAVVDSRAFDLPNNIVAKVASRCRVPEPRYLGRMDRALCLDHPRKCHAGSICSIHRMHFKKLRSALEEGPRASLNNFLHDGSSTT